MNTIAKIKNLGIPYRFITNTSRIKKSNLICILINFGLKLEPENILTAPCAAIQYCKESNFNKSQLEVPDPDMKEDFSCFNLVDRGSDAIILGDMGQKFNFNFLNRLFKEIMAGSHLIALHKNKYWLGQME